MYVLEGSCRLNGREGTLRTLLLRFWKPRGRSKGKDFLGVEEVLGARRGKRRTRDASWMPSVAVGALPTEKAGREGQGAEVTPVHATPWRSGSEASLPARDVSGTSMGSQGRDPAKG